MAIVSLNPKPGACCRGYNNAFILPLTVEHPGSHKQHCNNCLHSAEAVLPLSIMRLGTEELKLPPVLKSIKIHSKKAEDR